MRLSRRLFLAGSASTLAMPAVMRHARAQSGTIRLGWIRQFAPSGMVQKEVDLARSKGLEIEMIGFNRGLDGLLAMQQGSIDMTDCLIGYSQVCVGLGQGMDIKLISGSSRGLTEILIRPEELPDGTFDEKNAAYTGDAPAELLRGKRVGGARGSQQEFLLRYFLRENGLDFEKDIEFVDLKTNTDQSLALRQGSIDAACVIEPTAIQARIDGYAALLAFGYDKARVTTLNAGVVARSDFLAENADTVQTFIDAHVETMNAFKADREMWAKDTAAVTLFDPKTLGYLLNPADFGLDPKYWANLDLSETLPLGGLQEFAKSLYAAGFVQDDVSDKIPEHVDYAFLEKATGKSRDELDK